MTHLTQLSLVAQGSHVVPLEEVVEVVEVVVEEDHPQPQEEGIQTNETTEQS